MVLEKEKELFEEIDVEEYIQPSGRHIKRLLLGKDIYFYDPVFKTLRKSGESEPLKLTARERNIIEFIVDTIGKFKKQKRDLSRLRRMIATRLEWLSESEKEGLAKARKSLSDVI